MSSSSPRPVTWAAFERRLAKAIESMAPETFLIISTPAHPSDASLYVQFAHATDMFRAEAVMDRNLPPTQPLTDAQTSRLRELGWHEPAADDKGGNAYLDGPVPPHAQELAQLAVDTLRSVYDIGAPSDLRYQYGAFGGGTPRLPSLGIEPVIPLERTSSSKSAARTKPRPDVRVQLERALAEWLGAGRVEADGDGDYPIRAGSAVFYARPLDGAPPAISLFSPVLSGVARTTELLQAIDEINGRIRYARVFTVGLVVIVAMELPAIGLTSDHVAFACNELGNLADHLDGALHGRFGAQGTFDSSPKLLN